MALSALWGSLGKVVIGDKELSSLLVMAIACAAGITRRNLQEGEIRKEKRTSGVSLRLRRKQPEIPRKSAANYGSPSLDGELYT